MCARNCDESCIERLLGGGIDASCYGYAQSLDLPGNEIMSNAYDMAEATYDELIARGFCLYDLFRHYSIGRHCLWQITFRFYTGSREYARAHDELPLWRESISENIRCKQAIEDAIRQGIRRLVP